MSGAAQSLSEEMRRIWVMTAAGCFLPEIARAIGKCKKTTAWLRTELYFRIGARGIADATRLAVRHGLIVFPEV